MIYFSQLKKTPVKVEDNQQVGVLVDVVFAFKASPVVTKLVISNIFGGNETRLIAFSDVKSINGSITINKKSQTEELDQNELYVGKNLLDKQIIDIEGRKVVRVNDVLFQHRKDGRLFVVGVDTSISGLARWFGAEKIYSSLARNIGHGQPKILPWSQIQPLELGQGKVVLKGRQDRLRHFHPEDLADYLETTNIANVINTLNLLDREFASEVIAELNLNFQLEVFKKLGLEKTVEILTLMDPDEAVDVLLQFASRKRASILDQLESKKKHELVELLKLSKTKVGQYLTSEFVTIDRNDKASDITLKINRETRHIDFLDYLYVVNNKNRLIGVINIHELLLQEKDAPVYSFMTPDVVVVHLNTPLKLVFKKLIKYKISALPVINIKKEIVGLVTIDDIGEVFMGEI